MRRIVNREAKMPDDDLKKNPTTELRVIITEDALGNLDVEWQCLVKGTEITVIPRASHVIGQLQAAAVIVAAKSYKGLRDTVSSAMSQSNSKAEGKRRAR
jgi:hypothetical protein